MLDFKGRRRDVWGRFYTELFFLDEPTALAAGHRPCFECRRKDAEAFAEAWRMARGLSQRPYAAEMDEVLHRERLRGRAKRVHRRSIDTLPDGAFVAIDGEAFAVAGDALLRWTADGYAARTRGRATSWSTCSLRRRSWPCLPPAIGRTGTTARIFSAIRAARQ